MTRRARWMFVSMIAVAISVALAILTYVVSAIVPRKMWLLPANGLQSAYDQTAHSFYALHTAALIAAGGIIAGLIVTVPRSTRIRLWSCLILLAVVIPVSWLLHRQNNFVLPDRYQALSDLGIMFLGAICVSLLASAHYDSDGLKMVQAITIALLLFGAVIFPSIFLILWLLWTLGITNELHFYELVWKWATEAAFVISIALAGLYYLRQAKRSSGST